MHVQLTLIILFLSSASGTFVPVGSSARNSVALNLDKKIADMLDKQYYSMMHPEVARAKEENFRRRNAAYVPDNLPASFDGVDMIRSDHKDFVQYRKDKALASRDPQAYCAERCVSTGSCEVYEDIFDFSPEEVAKFCSECVLSEDEEPCDVPPEAMDSFFNSMVDSKLKP